MTTVADVGPGSLRQAILDSNASPGPDAIAFEVGSGGGQTIFSASPLPEVTDPVVIDGTTQPGYAGSPLIVLNGSRAGRDANGLTVSAGGSTVRGLVVNSFYYGNGILLQGEGGNRVVGNYIGTDVNGTFAVDVHNGNSGVAVFGGSDNLIGGTTAADRNLISGNGSQGVYIYAVNGTVVQGNYIGTDVTGTRALGNGFIGGGVGVSVSFAANTTVGGTAAGAGNLIAGHSGGIGFYGSSGSRVQGNFIGTDVTGTAALGNSYGVTFGDSVGNTVGGTEPGARNLISGSTQVGVSVSGEGNNRVEGNFIGTDVTGTRALGNAVGVDLTGLNNVVAGNLISGNTVYGVSVSGGTRVEGNFIGTDVTGAFGLPNGVGVRAAGFGAVVGGTAAGAGNLISGNATYGVELAGQNAVVQGNAIGTDATRTRALGNGTGVFITPFNPGVLRNVVGGAEPGAGNLISGNRGDGIAGRAEVMRIEGNLVGTDAAGAAAVPNGGHGMSFSYAENTVIGGPAAARNVISGNALSGIALGRTSSHTGIRGNFIGTNAAGTAALANGGHGIHVDSDIGHVTNVIGGTDAGSRNVISGNALDGVRLEGAVAGAFRVQGNFIGTDAAGTLALPNGGSGVAVNGGTGLQIGGSAPGAGNVISGNARDGVAFTGGGRHSVQGNYIGTDVTGDGVLPNGGNGVSLSDSSDNAVGGTAAGAGNVISGNGDFGVSIADPAAGGNVLSGNRIGTNAAGTAARGNGAGGVLIRSPGNTVGGAAPGAGNLISGNMRSSSHPFSDGAGVSIWGEAATGNVVAGNLIGTDATGTKALFNPRGVLLRAADNLIGGTAAGARNVISGNSTGVELEFGAHENRIEGNFIGTDAAGVAAIPNQWGVFLNLGPTGNVIGGTAPGAGNLISGNFDRGIYLFEATGNRVEGNRIGTDVAGSQALGNTVGVYAYRGGDNDIGGTAPGAGNLISGNRGAGVYLEAVGASTGNRVQGNLIGTDLSGTATLGNYAGVVLQSPGNLVGGTATGARNVISGNLTDGVLVRFNAGNVIQGNYIGTDAAGASALGNRGNGVVIAAASGTKVGGPEGGAGNVIAFNGGDGVRVGDGTGNAIRGNRVFANGGLGIDLGGDGVTPNDSGDADGGANQLQNFPVLSVARPGASTRVTGTLNSAADTTFTLDFYASPAADPSRFGEGARSLGSAVVTTDGSGTARFEVVLAGATAPGEVVTATATDPAGNTSEFSLAEVVAGVEGAVIIRRPRR